MKRLKKVFKAAARPARRLNGALCRLAFRTAWRLRARKAPNPGQVVFCSMDGDAFGNIGMVKAQLKAEGLPCFSCYGALSSLPKAVRAGIKLAGAEAAVLDAACEWVGTVPLEGRTAVVQAWHAAGAFKKFGLHSIDRNNPADLEKQKRLHGHYTWVSVSSEDVRSTYAEAFGMDPDRVVALGTPRLHGLLEADANRKEWKEWLAFKQEKTAGRKLVLYAPTYREIGKKRDYRPTLNMEGFAGQLPADAVLGVRLHPRAKKDDAKLPKAAANLSGIPQDVCLACADVLITDYSSIVFDFAALGRPALFYTPDEIAYGRGLYFSPRKEYPLLAFADWWDMADSIHRMLSSKDAWRRFCAETCRIRDRYVPHAGEGLERTAAFVKALTSAGSSQ